MHTGILSHFHGFLGCMNRTLMLLVTLVLFFTLISQMSVVKKDLLQIHDFCIYICLL